MDSGVSEGKGKALSKMDLGRSRLIPTCWMGWSRHLQWLGWVWCIFWLNMENMVSARDPMYFEIKYLTAIAEARQDQVKRQRTISQNGGRDEEMQGEG